jgi:hypothetical protein
MWSDTIIQLHNKKYTIDEIVEYFHTPKVTSSYVKKMLKEEANKTKVWNVRFRKDKLKFRYIGDEVHEKCMELPKKVFAEIVKNHQVARLQSLIGGKKNDSLNYLHYRYYQHRTPISTMQMAKIHKACMEFPKKEFAELVRGHKITELSRKIGFPYAAAENYLHGHYYGRYTNSRLFLKHKTFKTLLASQDRVDRPTRGPDDLTMDEALKLW